MSLSLRMMPTRSLIVCWISWWTVYGFSPPSRSSGARISPRAASSSASGAVGRAVIPFRYPAAPAPARRPKTSRSDSELPPSRFEPCMPPDTSPAANRPGTPGTAAVSGSTSTPPIT